MLDEQHYFGLSKNLTFLISSSPKVGQCEGRNEVRWVDCVDSVQNDPVSKPPNEEPIEYVGGIQFRLSHHSKRNNTNSA